MSEELELEGNQGLSFQDLGLLECVQQALTESGYVTPTPIQAAAIPELLAGRDVLGQAQTGTGKTAAFALPLLSRIDVRSKYTQVLVLAPTRELALQVSESFSRYGSELEGFRTAAIYGGASYTTQIDQLRRGAQVVVGTPGRVMDLMKRGTLRLDSLACLVLDEADEMLRMGFIEDVQWILSQTPEQRQIALFSATMPDQIRRIADDYLRDPAVITIASRQQTADNVRQRYLLARRDQKMELLARVLEAEPTDGVIVFVKTKMTCAEVAEELNRRGFAAAPLSGDVAQSQRQRTVEQLKDGSLDVLVATDVAARGLDVQRISHVINFDLPHDTEAYVHRIGRTGRAGRSGEAIVFVTPREQQLLRGIQRTTRQAIEPMDPPSVALINEQRKQRFKDRITSYMVAPQTELFAQLIQEYQAETEAPAEQIAAAIAAALQGERPLLLVELPRGNPRHDRGGRPDRFESRPFEGDDRERPQGGKRSFGRGGRSDAPMIRYRVEVGKEHGARPGNLVGAIANEVNLSSQFIGGIKMFDEFSFVDLPADLPGEALNHLRRVWVSGRQLRISRFERERSRFGKGRDREEMGGKPEGGAPFAGKFKGKKKKKALAAN